MSTDTLPFDPKRQDAVLGHLLVNERFFKQSKDRIKPTWFAEGAASKVWAARLNFYKNYGRIPTPQELLVSSDFTLENQRMRGLMTTKIQEATNLTTIYGLDTLLGQLTDWLHSRAFQDGVMKSQDLFNNGKTREAFAVLDEKLKYIKSTTFNDSPAYDFGNMIGNMERRTFEVANALSFGITDMDRLMLPQGTSGALLKGDTTVLLAPTNIGKTTTMVTVAAHNIRQGKSVLFYTHEGVDDDIAEKICCSLLNMNRAEFYALPSDPDPERRGWFDNAMKMLQRYLTYIPRNRAGLCVEDVVSEIRHQQDDRLAMYGVGYDLLVDDYPAKLISENQKYGQFQKRNMDEYVYDNFVQLALEYKFHSLLAQQANRTAGKINRGQKGFEERLLVPEDANEAYGPMQIATNVITINRDPESERLGYVTYYLGKSRSGEKGWALTCRSNYKNSITHSDTLGGTRYRGDVPLGSQVEEMMKRYCGQEIPNVRKAMKEAEG